MQKTSLVAVCLVFLAGSLSPATIPRLPFFYLGMGARQFSLGGSAAASFAGNAEDIWFNPAALALNEQFRGSASWGAPGTDNQYGGLGFSWPGDRGVFTVSGAYSAYTGGEAVSTGTAFLVKGAYSKQIMPTFLCGFGLNLAAAWPLPGEKLHPGISADLGMIILGKNPLLRDNTPRGFRIDDTSAGLSLLNLGLNPVTDAGRPSRIRSSRPAPDSASTAAPAWNCVRGRTSPWPSMTGPSAGGWGWMPVSSTCSACARGCTSAIPSSARSPSEHHSSLTV
jgi:hypothetical protein